MSDEPDWTLKYRPKTVADTILPPALKATFQSFVDSRDVPHLFLAGPPGMGKTTVARAMMNELACDHLVMNGSLDAHLGYMTQVKTYGSTVSLFGGRKYLIIDEADGMSQHF